MRNPRAKRSIDPNVFVTKPGCRKKKVRSPVFDGSKVVLEVTGEIDIQDQINSYAPLTDMSFILSRLGQGDTSVLNQTRPFYGSMLDVPTSYRDMMDITLRAESAFNSLSLDVRRSFNNDYRVWLASTGTREWSVKMSEYLNNGGSSNARPDGNVPGVRDESHVDDPGKVEK